MRKTWTLLMIIMIGMVPILVKAQQTANRISGKITDNKQTAIASATVALLKAADSSLVKNYVSGKDGQYTIENIPAGAYLVKISATGHKTVYSASFEVNATKSIQELPAISMTAVSRELSAVTVTASRPMIEMKIDRTVVNVDAAVTNTGANALEVLEKAPGVQVDKDGNISLKGKQGVIIMLDGRPTYLTGSQLAEMLKGMQASQLDQIEIMTNPPAKYDAAGNSGIINIKTKKNKMKGFNGNVSAGYGQGIYPKTNNSLSLNYRNSKVNLFSNYSFGRNNNWQQLDIFRRYKNDDGSTRAIFEQVSEMRRRNLNNNLKLGMDYYISTRTTVGIVFSGYANNWSNLGDNTSFLKNPQYVTDSIVTAKSHIKENWKNASVNLNLRHQFDTTGRELSFDIDYLLYKGANDQHFVNTTMMPDRTPKNQDQLAGDLPTDIKIYSAKADYTHPLGGKAKLEIGFKSSYVVTDSRANYYFGIPDNIDEPVKWAPDYTKINYFEYKENINAGYVSLNKQLTEKLGLQAGLRYENTNYTGTQYGNPTRKDSAFKRNYDSWFPTVYLSYQATKNNQFGISFGRRIDRPAYQSLNPFLFFIDKYTYEVGNPYLRPQYSNNFELTHIWKGILTTTLNYSVTKDLFTETFTQEELANGEKGFATIVRDGNIGKRQSGGIALNAQIPIAKWLNTNLYTNYNYTKFSGQLYGDEVDIQAGNMLVSMNNQFKFNKGWSAELSGWYRTKGVEGQILIDPMGALSTGIAKQVLKGNGSIKLNVRDIFYTQKAEGTINFKATEAAFKNRRDTRVVNLTFTYRFGKTQNGNGNNNRKRGGANEEQNRVQGGGN